MNQTGSPVSSAISAPSGRGRLVGPARVEHEIAGGPPRPAAEYAQARGLQGRRVEGAMRAPQRAAAASRRWSSPEPRLPRATVKRKSPSRARRDVEPRADRDPLAGPEAPPGTKLAPRPSGCGRASPRGAPVREPVTITVPTCVRGDAAQADLRRRAGRSACRGPGTPTTAHPSTPACASAEHVRRDSCPARSCGEPSVR